jgi:quercetin dioxygenase-like cupin family protein
MTASPSTPSLKRTIHNPVTQYSATFIRTTSETGGKVSELSFTLQPGGGNEPHYHKTYSETFTAVKGQLGLRKSGKTIMLNEGESCTVDPGEVHCFFNPASQVVEFKIEIHPGHEGFENALRILYGLAADGLTNKKGIPTKLSHISLIATMSDMNLPGFFTMVFPLLKIIASRARRKGEEAALFKRYCI